MSCVGLDIGNENCIVGVARLRGIDVVLNDESKRETPAMVCFGEKQRFLGTAAAAVATMNVANTVSQIKRLIGRKFRDPEVQRDLRFVPFQVTEGQDGGPLIHVRCLGDQMIFTPTEILGAILANLKTIGESNLQSPVSDCVIGLPVYFTDLQRRAYLDAAAIAGLKPHRLMHDTTAAALSYGIYKTDLPDNEPVHVVFVDIGHASMQVCVAAFRKGELRILGLAWDRCLGGRDFDEVLFNHFASKFKAEYNIDVASSARASLRLRASCEKLKKVLSANAEAPLSIESLIDGKDVRGFIRREEFEKLATPILERVRIPCENALSDSNVSVDKISAVEVIGSGSRIPAIGRILATVFKKEASRTLNASECIARGCALQCAILSPTFKVREFEVHDYFPFSIGLSWKGPAPECTNEGRKTTDSGSIVFPKGSQLPSRKILTFNRPGPTFTFDFFYAEVDDLPPATSSKISTYTIGPFTPSKSDKARMKIKIHLNLHGIVRVEAASMVDREEVQSHTHSKQRREVATSEIDHDGSDISENEVTSLGVQSEPSVEKVDGLKVNRVKKINVPVSEAVLGGFSHNDLKRCIEKEHNMALQDRLMEETKEKRNALEAYVYDMRNKLHASLQTYASNSELQQLLRTLQETEDWLYDEGEDETKSVYDAKLIELKRLSDPIEFRHKEEAIRDAATVELIQCIKSYQEGAQSDGPKFYNIDRPEKEKVISECRNAEDWLKEKQLQQNALPRNVNPVLLSSDIRRQLEYLDRFCRPIMTKPTASPSKSPKSSQS